MLSTGGFAGWPASYDCGVMTPGLECPDQPEDVAEALLLHHLSADQAETFVTHILECPRCAEVVSRTQSFIRAIRDASVLGRIR
jgi:hypothetical protein